jgi:hypothetical protein
MRHGKPRPTLLEKTRVSAAIHEDSMSPIEVPLYVRLLLHVAGLSLEIKALKAEVCDLKARLAQQEPPHDAV